MTVPLDKLKMPTREDALPGSTRPMEVDTRHFVLDAPLDDAFEGMQCAMFGMGCFWGVERQFWQLEGVVSTAVGYSAGYTPNPGYEEVCSGKTGHNEVIRVIFDPTRTSYDAMLKHFWENHNPTQGMRQGNDLGTQYRSGIYTCSDEQNAMAKQSLAVFQNSLTAAGYGTISTEILPAAPFYFAEDYHQQYLAKNPGGYCGVGGTGVSCPVGLHGSIINSSEA